MILIEFERTKNISKKDCTAVRVFNTALPEGRQVLAETIYLGQPPQLAMEPGCPCVVLRLPADAVEPSAADRSRAGGDPCS